MNYTQSSSKEVIPLRLAGNTENPLTALAIKCKLGSGDITTAFYILDKHDPCQDRAPGSGHSLGPLRSPSAGVQ